MPILGNLGFGPGDALEFFLAAVLLLVLLIPWRATLAHNPRLSMVLFFALPVVLRIALFVRHPAPHPDIYDEFAHLFTADTLRHGRLANPAHPLSQFFETFFILQQPSRSSIYPIGQGLLLLFGWTGVLLASGAFCSLSYWMLRAWVSPEWAFIGGILAVMEFGPVNQWTNSYWGGHLAAASGALVFGALPRLTARFTWLCAIGLAAGIGLHLLTRPYETVFLVLAVLLYRLPVRTVALVALLALPALGITLLQNYRVTGNWLTLPYSLSQTQYGVPASLTFLPQAEPHRQLTREQDLDYRMQRGFRAQDTETVATWLNRLIYRTRYYRFFFYPPLYFALLAFLFTIRTWRLAYPAVIALLFAAGVNFFPAFQYHYLAAITCLFILMSVIGLERLGAAGPPVLCLCVALFLFEYATFATAKPQPTRRELVAGQIAAIRGPALVFVRYWPTHKFQEEWVWNAADIDASPVIMARDLGEPENDKLRRYYPSRSVWLLEPDANPPSLGPYTPESAPEAPSAPANQPPTRPGLVLENIPDSAR